MHRTESEDQTRFALGWYYLTDSIDLTFNVLQVKNREKYHFQPRTLLSELIDIYLNLNSVTFIKAVSKDTRSYKKEYFSKAASILLRHGLKHQDDITKLERFVNRVEVAIQEGQEEEEELGNVPDEFLGQYLGMLSYSYIS
jgi:ubiquitin conjugation factor E4 B